VLMNITVGCLLMVATTVVHAGAMIIVLHLAGFHREFPTLPTRGQRLAIVSGTVLVVFLAALVEVSLWAATYVGVGAIPEAETALYFSTVTFTTLGYGDVVLSDRWRLLASFEAANGIILFGWSTAMVIATVQRAYVHYLHPDVPASRQDEASTAAPGPQSSEEGPFRGDL
jgi:hypothetical protein